MNRSSNLVGPDRVLEGNLQHDDTCLVRDNKFFPVRRPAGKDALAHNLARAFGRFFAHCVEVRQVDALVIVRDVLSVVDMKKVARHSTNLKRVMKWSAIIAGSALLGLGDTVPFQTKLIVSFSATTSSPHYARARDPNPAR